MNIQGINNVFREGFSIKAYEIRNHDQSWPSESHAHAYAQLWYVYEGKCIHKIDGKAYVVNEGELFIVPPFVEHSVSVKEENCTIYGCDFIFEMLSKDEIVNSNAQKDLPPDSFITNLLRIQGKYTLPEYMQSWTENTLRKMMMVYLKEQPYCMIELKGYLLRLLVNIYQCIEITDVTASNLNAHTKDINDAIAYINEHMAERIYLEEVANHVSMSVRSFNHYFKEYTGKTFVDYLNILRIDAAKILLAETALGISVVGRRVGFADSAYFNRQFRKYVGCTPGEYRTNNKDV